MVQEDLVVAAHERETGRALGLLHGFSIDSKSYGDGRGADVAN